MPIAGCLCGNLLYGLTGYAHTLSSMPELDVLHYATSGLLCDPFVRLWSFYVTWFILEYIGSLCIHRPPKLCVVAIIMRGLDLFRVVFCQLAMLVCATVAIGKAICSQSDIDRYVKHMF